MRMSIKQLIQSGESKTLEFKKSTGEWKEIIETISAEFSALIRKKVFQKLGTTERGTYYTLRPALKAQLNKKMEIVREIRQNNHA